MDMMRLAWKDLKKNSAIADDDITVKEYAANLEVNLEGSYDYLMHTPLAPVIRMLYGRGKKFFIW